MALAEKERSTKKDGFMLSFGEQKSSNFTEKVVKKLEFYRKASRSSNFILVKNFCSLKEFWVLFLKRFFILVET